MLTNAAVKAARPMTRAYKKWDAGGLSLLVAPNGRRSWLLRVRRGGRELVVTLGEWPELTLDAARQARDAARAAIDAGVDPRAAANDRAMTFEEAARAWHAHAAPGWSPVHARDVIDSLERDVFPAIGALALDAIDQPVVLAALKRIEARGAIETARRVRHRVRQSFAFAKANGWCSAEDQADVLVGLGHIPAEGEMAALVDVGEIRALMEAVDALPSVLPSIRAAHRLLALTAVRLAVVRMMTWSEVENLDGPAPLWRVPAAHMKLAAKYKTDSRRDHLVPLSPAAVAVLRSVQELHISTSVKVDGMLVFAGRDGTGPLGEGAIGELYARAGFAGRHVPHGWRASFSTVMNERRPNDRAAVDRTLGHKVRGVSGDEGAYNRAQHLGLRRSIMEEWASIIA